MSYKEIINNIKGIEKFLLTNYTIERTDRLWPSDYRIFKTNPLSLAYGACGIIEFLIDIGSDKEYLNKFFQWILKHKIDDNSYPPGLYVGLSGIAWVLEEGGLKKESQKIMNIANKSELIYKNLDVFYGISGLGITNLHFWYKFQDEEYLNKAYQLGDYLVNNFPKINERSFWNNKEGKIYLGYAHGSSGVALFLLYLYLAEKNNKYLDYAIKYLGFDLSNIVEENNKITIFSDTDNKKTYFPYWEYGNSGLILVLLRFYKVLHDKRYKEIAIKSAEFINVRYSSTSGLFFGLSSIGEAFVDMSQFLNDTQYQRIATEIANNVLMYSIKTDKGIIYPGDLNLRLTCDYGTGSAGIGTFLNRLINNGKRKFVNDYLLEGV